MNASGDRRTCALLLVPLGLAVLSGCNPVYVARAGLAEARILWRRQPIVEFLREDDLPPEIREKLEVVLAARTYAAGSLGLAAGGSYRTVSRVEPGETIWVVSAAPRDRLVLHTWWFPFVGRVPYRGYFSEKAARRLAEDMERQGYDTYVRTTAAFSTLGWFDDPLLSPTLKMDVVTIAAVVIHELLHNTVYLPGRTAFNESLANFVGWRGAAELFAARGDAERRRQALDVWADELSFSRHLGLLIDRLRHLYAGSFTEAERRELFRSWASETAAAAWRTDRYRGIADAELNNAVVLHYRLYADRLELFERAYLAHGNDLRAVIDELRARLVSEDEDPFEVLAATLPAAVEDLPHLSPVEPSRPQKPSPAPPNPISVTCNRNSTSLGFALSVMPASTRQQSHLDSH